MRRREVPDEELNQVIRLKQSGVSWLKIEHRTGVPRRSAKKAYEDWQRSQSKKDLKQARIQIAAELFREHVESIVQVAELLIDDLPQSMMFHETRDAERVLSELWRKDLAEGPESLFGLQEKPERQQQRILRQNQLLFQSLKDHTREKVRWQVLEEWKEGWNACLSALAKLRTEAEATMTSILNNQHRSVKNAIKNTGKEKAIIDQMVTGVVEALWRGILDGKPEKAHDLVRIMVKDKSSTLVVFGEQASVTLVEVADKHLAEDVGNVCKWIANNLYIVEKETLIRQFQSGVDTMKKAMEELNEKLNPLMLRPMILDTTCDLCPA
jgi:hypothetical protein